MDLREQLQSTYDKMVADAAPETPVVEAPAPAEAAAAPETPATAPTPEAAAGAPERDESGRFKAKASDTPAQAGAEAPATPAAETKPPEPAATAGQEPQPTETIRVPHALPAPLKAKFGDLPAEWRDAFVKQEDSIKAFKDEQAPKAARLNRFDEIMGPRRERWALSGLDEFSGIQALLAAQDFLERNPVEGLHHIARSYGVDLRTLAGQASQRPTAPGGQPAPTVMPELQNVIQPLAQQVQALQQQLQQSQQQSEQQKLAEAQAEVQSFINDPAHMYFENVRDEVAALLKAGRANSLAEAYEKAVWASHEIRPLLLAEQGKAAQAETARKAQEQAARTKAAAAQQAAGSVTGSPTPGAAAPRGPIGSIRDSLEAAAREVGYQV